MTTFGHCYEILRVKRLEHLNELGVKGTDYPYSWFDRQAHYTLNPSDPESIQLIHDLLDEYLPLFSSNYFNICCDETIDLDVGLNKKAGKDPGESYINFTKQVINAVVERGRHHELLARGGSYAEMWARQQDAMAEETAVDEAASI